VAFVHPKGTGGVLVELSQKQPQSLSSTEGTSSAAAHTI
jgi:methylmalonyl-CoA/ethylmalonyl-CoA epimerase